MVLFKRSISPFKWSNSDTKHALWSPVHTTWIRNTSRKHVHHARRHPNKVYGVLLTRSKWSDVLGDWAPSNHHKFETYLVSRVNRNE
jgi:hypothetical protein